jgi:hypothetical protein
VSVCNEIGRSVGRFRISKLNDARAILLRFAPSGSQIISELQRSGVTREPTIF